MKNYFKYKRFCNYGYEVHVNLKKKFIKYYVLLFNNYFFDY